MPDVNYEKVDSFRISRNVARRAKQPFERLRVVQNLAATQGTSIRAHAGIVALDLVASQEIVHIQDELGERFNEHFVRAPINTMRRDRALSIGNYLPFGLQKRVVVYEEGGGDLTLGIPFTADSQEFVTEERDLVAEHFSRWLEEEAALPDEEEYYLTIGKMSEDKVTEDQADAFAAEAERLLWTPDAQGIVVGDSVDLIDANVFSSRALTVVEA